MFSTRQAEGAPCALEPSLLGISWRRLAEPQASRPVGGSASPGPPDPHTVQYPLGFPDPWVVQHALGPQTRLQLSIPWGSQTLGWLSMLRAPRPAHSSASPGPPDPQVAQHPLGPQTLGWLSILRGPQTHGWFSMPRNTADFNSATNGPAGHTFSLNSANSLLFCFNSGHPVFLTL